MQRTPLNDAEGVATDGVAREGVATTDAEDDGDGVPKENATMDDEATMILLPWDDAEEVDGLAELELELAPELDELGSRNGASLSHVYPLPDKCP